MKENVKLLKNLLDFHQIETNESVAIISSEIVILPNSLYNNFPIKSLKE